MLASLLMAAALPEALGEHGLLFAASYVALQLGRNAAAASLLAWEHPLRDVFERLVVWSALTGVLWLAGAALDGDQRLLLWIPALAVDLAAPVAGYWLPGRGRAATSDYDIEGGHFAERCQLFIIIALGESIVVTGATAAQAGLTAPRGGARWSHLRQGRRLVLAADRGWLATHRWVRRPAQAPGNDLGRYARRAGS